MQTTWDDEMATGASEIDDEHRRIADTLDRLQQSVAEIEDRAAVAAALTTFVETMCEHIEHEEALIQALAEDGAGHTKAHNIFISMLSNLVVDYQNDSRHLATDIIDLIRTWKQQHIRAYDRPLARAVLAGRTAVRSGRNQP